MLARPANMNVMLKPHLVQSSVGVLMVVFILSACSSNSSSTAEKMINSPATSQNNIILSGDEEVLVTIEGDEITQYDLQATAEKTLGKQQASVLTDVAKNKILESLVISRVMAKTQEESMEGEDKARLEKEVNAYREQLLVKQYIKNHITPEPVTQQMVANYYNKHPEKFGSKNIQAYEMISAVNKPSPTERDKLISSMEALKGKSDWDTSVKDLVANGHQVSFHKSVLNEKTLHPKLKSTITQLAFGATSSVSFIEGKPYMIRRLKQITEPPKPLSQVSSEIRKSLVPIQLRKQIKQHAKELLVTADIKYQ